MFRKLLRYMPVGLIFTAVITAFLAFYLWSFNSINADLLPYYAHDKSADGLQSNAEVRQPCAKPANSTDSLICAEWRSVQIARAELRWVAGGVLVTLLGAVGVFFTLRQGRKALESARSANESAQVANQISTIAVLHQLRPYVQVTAETDKEQNWDREGSITFIVKNYGQTPAENLKFGLAHAFADEVCTPDGYKSLQVKTMDAGALAPQAYQRIRLICKRLSDHEYCKFRNGYHLLIAIEVAYSGLGLKNAESNRYEFLCDYREKYPAVATAVEDG